MSLMTPSNAAARTIPAATRHSPPLGIVPQVVETELLDAGTLLRLVPRRRALMAALAGEGEAPAPVLTPRRLERRHGVRIERNTAALARLRGAMIEPCHLASEIHPTPFEPVNLACTTASRQRELHDRLHVPRQCRDQSVSLLASQEAHAPAGFLQHPNLRNPTQPTPILMRDVQYPPNHLESAIDSRVRDAILRLAIANVPLQFSHIDRSKPQRSQIGVELLQMILVIEEALLIRKLLEIPYDRLLPYEN